MNIDFDLCYQALSSRDRRFDGRFYLGVTSTGIYCRPVCPARLPKPENCRFYRTAAEAEGSGFRPCKRCRPECAPGLAHIDMPGSLINKACQLIESGFLNHKKLPDLATRLGVTERHLRRLFQQSLGVSPLDYVRSWQLLQARQLLMLSRLSVMDIAFQCGFNSLRSFNYQFRQRYQQSPTELRKENNTQPPEHLTLKLGYRPPFDWKQLLTFLASRRIPGVEEVGAEVYRRTVRIKAGEERISGWLEVTDLPEKCQLQLTLSQSLAPVALEVSNRVRRLFDLDCDPQAISHQLKELSEDRPGLRLPGAFDGFEMSVRAILGQQVTVKAAHTLATRVAHRFGEPLDTPFNQLTHSFPSARVVSQLEPEQLGELGIIRQRSKAILAVARSVDSGDIDLSALADVPETLERLQALPGIGPWTAQYIAMRALSWPDAFPDQDLGVIKAMGTKNRKEIVSRAEPWRPWRAYAVMHLWHQNMEGAEK